MYRILLVNLGGTSTKLALFEDETLKAEVAMRHTDAEISACTDNKQQIAFRKEAAQNWLGESGISLDMLDAAVIRVSKTGLCKKSGTYQVKGKLRDAMYEVYRQSFPLAMHPAFIILPLVDEMLEGRDIPIYIVDPEEVDEFHDVARVTGHPGFPRTSGVHMLNHKAVARRAAADLGKAYEETKLVVAHLGGGVSIAAHDHGMIVDGTSGGSAGEGPFGTNRTGPLPINQLVERCYSGEYKKQDIIKMIMSEGGFLAHTGFTDMRIIEESARNGDENCDLLIRAFIYQVCRYIGAQFTVLNCEADAIVLTGGISYSERVVGSIKDCVGKLAPVVAYPGEEESEAMVSGALRVLRGEAEPIIV